MRGDTVTENEAEAVEHGGSAASAERRPSIVTLENMLKKVSHSPFLTQYQTLVSSVSDSSGSSVNEFQNKQDGDFLADLSAAAAGVTDNHQLHVGQNGRQERLRLTPQESGGEDRVMEDSRRKTSEDLEFQSSPLDLWSGMPTVTNGGKFSGLPKDLFQTATTHPAEGHFQTPTLTQKASANGHFHDVGRNSADLFKPVPAQIQNLYETSQFKSSELFEDDLFRTRGVNLFEGDLNGSAKTLGDVSNKPTPANPFHTAASKSADLSQAVPTKSGEVFRQQDPSMEEDLFGMSSFKDVFSPSSANAVDPFPSPITWDLSQGLSSSDDPFGATPSRQYNPFHNVSPGTPDIFKPLPSKTNGGDLFGITSSSKYSTPLLNSPSAMKLDVLSPPDLFKATTAESRPAVQPKSSDAPRDIILTTPQGTKHEILQPSPFSRARNLSMAPGQSPSEMTHVRTFKRPPRPLPRTRPPRMENPPMPEKPPMPEMPQSPANPIEHEATASKTSPKQPRTLPKPVVHHKPKTPETRPLEPENSDFFEDVLLIGQERCVEDWPEDSPQLHPDFKPSGTLRLRRESLRVKGDSDGGSGEDQDGSPGYAKKKDKKFRLSLLSRRGSKEKFPDDTKEWRSKSVLSPHKSSKDFFSDVHEAADGSEAGDQNGTDYKKKSLSTKVGLLRRASTSCTVPAGKPMNGHLPQETKGDDVNSKGVSKKNSIIRRWSEGTPMNDSTGEEEEEGGEAQHEEVDSHGSKKKKKRVKIRFVPQRGFSITVEKGAPSPRKSTKEKSQDEYLGAHGYTPRTKSQDDSFEDVEERSHSLPSNSKAAFMDDDRFLKSHHSSAGLNGDEDPYGMEDCKPKKSTKMKMLQAGRWSSKEDMLEDGGHQKKKSSFSAEDLYDEDRMEDWKPKTSKDKPTSFQHKSKTANGQSESIGFSHQIPQQAFNDPIAEDDFMPSGKYFDSDEDDVETCKPKKTSKLKGFKKHKSKSKATKHEFEDPPGAASSDFLSEAAKAEWQAAQLDERAMAGMEDEDEDGDTDSLMEWWNTVEQWDEVPSDDEDKVIKEDESKSFTILADKVYRGLRVFNKVFTERAEILWQSIIRLHAIADNINNFHHKAKIAGITGGTTTAVGGVTAIAGLALAPFTFGASLVITAVGVGVATAGGIASASAAISDNVNNMHDRKKVEMVLEEYEAHLLAIGKILHFVNHGVYKLRGHPFLRSGTQHYSEDWEIRRAVQMISLVDSPVMRGTEVTDASLAAVQGLFRGMDKYFIKDSRELKKGCKKEVVGQIKEVANVLNDGIVELNAIREELQAATGNM